MSLADGMQSYRQQLLNESRRASLVPDHNNKLTGTNEHHEKAEKASV